MLCSIIDSFSFPAVGALLAHLLYFLLQYPTDPTYYRDQAFIIIYITIGVGFSTAFTNPLALWMGNQLGENIMRKLRLRLFKKIMGLPLTWFEKEENQH